jgi:CDGSH-type Zn-finger protein
MTDANKPLAAGKEPQKVELKAGDRKAWCQCGHSNGQPFCDGSHKETGMKPVLFAADKDGDAYLCMCKRTANPPYCDGTHNRLGEITIGGPAPEVPDADSSS